MKDVAVQFLYNIQKKLETAQIMKKAIPSVHWKQTSHTNHNYTDLHTLQIIKWISNLTQILYFQPCGTKKKHLPLFQLPV